MVNSVGIIFILILVLAVFYTIYLFKNSYYLLKIYKQKFLDFFSIQDESVDINKYIKENWPSEINSEIKYALGEKKDPGSIRANILNDISPNNSLIRTLGNLFPAIGLIATFLGLFLTLFQLRLGDTIITAETFTNVIKALNHLSPVFLVGFIGIVSYGIILLSLNKLEKYQNLITNELVSIYLEFESTYFLVKITNVEEVYERLIKPLNKVLITMNVIVNNFNKISSKTEIFIDEIGNRTDNFINKFSMKTEEFITTIDTGIQDTIIKFKDTSINLLNNLNNEFFKNIEILDKRISLLNNVLQNLSLVLETNIQKLNNLAENSIK